MVLKSDGADAQDCDAIRTETLSSGTTRPCGDITREAPVAEDEWNGARDEEYPFTHGRYRSLPTEELADIAHFPQKSYGAGKTHAIVHGTW